MATPAEPRRPRTKPSDIPETSRVRNYRFLTLQGGGMKGVGYVGAIEELEASGMLIQIEEVAGSSAGAIVATLLAVGYTAKEIREVMTTLDFRDFQDVDSPGWIEATGLKDMLGGGLDLLQEHDRYKILSDISRMRRMPLFGGVVRGFEMIEKIGALVLGKELGLWTGNTLLSTVAAMIARKTGKPNLTFKELSALAKNNPGVFCALTLTGSNLTTRKLEYYNARDWPDMPIMDAVRISASFPGAFKPVSKPIVKRIHENGVIETSPGDRVDGGLLENLPDVFNKPPYFQPSDAQPGNPDVLALSFQERSKEKETELRTGLDLARALYKTKMSEEDLRQKYADNIIFVDPKGVDTLDFDADEHQILALADSGGEATRTFFQEVLSLEKLEKPNFEAMSLRELVRQEIAVGERIRKQEEEFHTSSGEQPMLNYLIVLQQWIKKKEVGHTLEEINQIREQEKSRFQRTRSTQNRMISSKDLINACKRKINEVGYLKKEFELRLKQVNLVRVGFGLRISELEARFKASKENNDIFKKQSEEIRSLQGKILKLKQEIALLELQEAELTPEEKFKLQNDRAAYEALIVRKQELFGSIISHYQTKNDMLMVHYFEELRQSCEDIFFEPPIDSEDIHQQLKGEIDKCDHILKEIKKEIKKIASKKQILAERVRHFEDRELSSGEYTTLVDLQNDLNKSIVHNTNLLGKILQYCVSEKPSLKKNVITFLFQTLSFLAFAAKVSFSIGTFFPLITYAIARLTKRFSHNPKTVSIANRIIRVFQTPNLFKLNKLRELRKMTAYVLEVLNKNYSANADKSEQTYLYTLFTYYLKSSGLSLKDILPRRNNETEKQYLKRIVSFKDKLGLTALSKHPSLLSRAFTKNMNHLHATVMQESHPSKDQSKEIRSLTFRRNMDVINLKYLEDLNKKFKQDKILPHNELLEYIHSASALGIQVPNNIQNLFLSMIKEKLTSATLRLTQEEFVAYLELEPSLPGQEIVKLRAIFLADKGYQEWLSNYESPKSKAEIEQAWQIFFDYTRRQSDKSLSIPEKPKPSRPSKPYRKPSPNNPLSG